MRNQVNLLADAGVAVFGQNWKSPMAKAIGMSRRHLIRLSQGRHPISRPAFVAMREVCEAAGVFILSIVPPADEPLTTVERCVHCGAIKKRKID